MSIIKIQNSYSRLPPFKEEPLGPQQVAQTKHIIIKQAKQNKGHYFKYPSLFILKYNELFLQGNNKTTKLNPP